ncbi:hypothetical protein FH063_002101 [Azospirillum argentinense]|uniref:Uncharacterized protein n=1 Tax=Azospirillum argentinense TaxID=2970906 RepID=A0A5B0KPH2_9PROT|nr:hypothetical protein FH063_002101 [Azospirillum argentinense]
MWRSGRRNDVQRPDKKRPDCTSDIVGGRGRDFPVFRHCENAATEPTALKRTASVPW